MCSRDVGKCVCGPPIGMQSAKYPECALTTTAHDVFGVVGGSQTGLLHHISRT